MRVKFYNADGGLMSDILTDSPSRVINARILSGDGFETYEITDDYGRPEPIGRELTEKEKSMASAIPDPLADTDSLFA